MKQNDYKGRVDFIFDSETLSEDSKKCAILDFSCMCFEWDKFVSDKPYTTKSIVEVKKFKLDAKDQVTNHNFKISKDTLKWWSNQSKAAQKAIAPKPDDLSLEDFVKKLNSYLMKQRRISFWWSRGNTFDPIILERILEEIGNVNIQNDILKFWSLRDIRTHIDAKFDYDQSNSFTPISDTNFWEKVFVPHDSRWDVLADVLRLQAIRRAEKDLPQVER